MKRQYVSNIVKCRACRRPMSGNSERCVICRSRVCSACGVPPYNLCRLKCQKEFLRELRKERAEELGAEDIGSEDSEWSSEYSETSDESLTE